MQLNDHIFAFEITSDSSTRQAVSPKSMAIAGCGWLWRVQNMTTQTVGATWYHPIVTCVVNCQERSPRQGRGEREEWRLVIANREST